MDDLKDLFRKNYLLYASYVILDRAIPHIIDGLKPVQRRILWTLFQMDDGKLHKVANVAGQTMALHPHGDAPIIDALVNLANKGYLLETQGNFGNPSTGDPPAAARYIETRLGELAKETLFNPLLTQFLPSYDGRAKEPVVLPAKIPLLLMQGAEGIAVGMSTKILPHNFKELLEAQIAILEEKPFKILPDFPSGGILDPTDYNKGQGKVKLRAKIEVLDDKTLRISEICHGTTTESLIRSIDEAAKKGKIKIESINDYTAEKIEIEIKLPRGQHSSQIIDALYAFTECEVTIHTQLLVIKDSHPLESSVDDVLTQHLSYLKGYLEQELLIEQGKLLEKIFEKTLEQIFIENRLYKKIEEISTYPQIHSTIAQSLQPFHKQLARIPSEDDREKLLAIPIRRISRFDVNKNLEDIATIEKRLQEIAKHLKNIKGYTVRYLQGLLKKYGSLFPRRTVINQIEQIDKRAISEKTVRVGYDPDTGFMGTKIGGAHQIACSSFDRLLLFYQDGTYTVINVPEKQYVHGKDTPLIWVGIADKSSVIGIIFRNKKTKVPSAKRFIIKQYILDKEYRYMDPEQELMFLTEQAKVSLKLTFASKAKKVSSLVFSLDEVPIKGVNTKGIRIANKELKTVTLIQDEEKNR